MVTEEEKDVIGEVIAEDAAMRCALIGVKNVNSEMSTIDKLRQQLADVSRERDLLRARKQLTQEQALIISAYTGFMFVREFSSLHGFIEKVLGRPVHTAEMGDGKIFEELRSALGSAFKDLVPDADEYEVKS